MRTRRSLLRLFAGVFALIALPIRRGRTEEPLGGLWRCTNGDCDPYIYDPALGDEDNIAGDHPIPPGTRFQDLPDDWLCPFCGEPKASFIRHHPL